MVSNKITVNIYICFVFVISFSAFCSSNNTLLGYPDKIINLVNAQIKKGVNFSFNNYVITYSCGGGAICGGVYNPKTKEFVQFPDDYQIDNFKVTFSKNSSEIYFNGSSAIDNKKYKDKCFLFDEHVFLECEKD
ncbi:hypothetical protein [Photobacterium damselae]|uniref:Transmembrane protein n=1 Tax=Photobacterium damselae TaxID=38293 RepID=A0ABD6X7J9_PHODM|nr:hypothetical protein [Photobacterium damselae]OBU43476.1 hypothetical protein AYY27_17410 [Photobacterium damselae]PSU19104.1 hypothetical protein CTM90_03795 [Photobacterium damselae]